MRYLLNGIMIGLIFGMPIGAVGAMSLQRTIQYGSYAGFMSGLASSFADVLYACAGAFGFTIISDFLLDYQMPINLIGATLLFIIAINMILDKKEMEVVSETGRKTFVKMFFSSFVVAITNPAAILSFLFAFSVFGIDGSLGLMDSVQVVAGIFIGTLSWWGFLVIIGNLMKKKLHTRWLHNLNTAFGILLILFSCGIVIKTL